MDRGIRSHWLGLFDADEIKRIHESGSAKSVKRQWIKEGYDQQLSLYGVITDREADESGYKRIEVLSNMIFNEVTLLLIYHFFKSFIPESPYTIWIYDKDRESVKQVGAYK